MSETEKRGRGRPAGAKNKKSEAPQENTTGPVELGTKERVRRVPISGNRDVLTAPKREGYVRRFVNDDERGLRIQMFQNAGWALVRDKDVQIGDKNVTNRNNSIAADVVRSHVGSGRYAYLMEIKREWYEEDQKAKEEELKKTDDAMRAQSNEEGRYGEIKIS